jgi:murein DD-endopeptidase MepM/ murein hydrolase activator NlpD
VSALDRWNWGARLLAAALLVSGCAGSYRAATPAGVPVPDMVFPLAADSVRFTSGFGDARGGSRSHHGQDLFCPRWTPVLAAVSGTVDGIAAARPKPGKSYSLFLHGDDGNVYFYDHLNNDDPGSKDNRGEPGYAYARDLRNGARVSAGEIVGYVGDSGNAEPAGPHLHFEIHVGHWGNPIDPAPALRAALRRRSH